LGVYGIELPMIAAWTGKPTVIDIVLGLFSMTTKFVESPPSESGVDQGLLTQLPELASILFACIQERLDWLGRCVCFVLGGLIN
jgi:nuclear pore complex protein Nup133